MSQPAFQATKISSYWQVNSRFTLLMCLVWLSLNFIALFFAREIAELSDWSLLSFVLIQGLMLAYLMLIVVFNFTVAKFKSLRQGQSDE